MKIAALLFTFTPWLSALFFWWADSVVAGNPSEAFRYIWVFVSPFWLGLGIFVASKQEQQA